MLCCRQFVLMICTVVFVGCGADHSSRAAGDSAGAPENDLVTARIAAGGGPLTNASDNEAVVGYLVVDADAPLLDAVDAAPARMACVCIRGVLELNEQLSPGHLVNIELRRQVRNTKPSVRGSSGPAEWEMLSTAALAEVLLQTRGLGKDPVPPECVNPVVTMPLPARKDGDWDSRVSHPQLSAGKLLCRALDFSVRPGSEYRYAFRVEYADRPKPAGTDFNVSEGGDIVPGIARPAPNHPLDPNYRDRDAYEDPATPDDAGRLTPDGQPWPGNPAATSWMAWSQPSAWIVVETDRR